jgi:hypothetical protein
MLKSCNSHLVGPELLVLGHDATTPDWPGHTNVARHEFTTSTIQIAPISLDQVAVTLD